MIGHLAKETEEMFSLKWCSTGISMRKVGHFSTCSFAGFTNFPVHKSLS